jgi:hypothetical protein
LEYSTGVEEVGGMEEVEEVWTEPAMEPVMEGVAWTAADRTMRMKAWLFPQSGIEK